MGLLDRMSKRAKAVTAISSAVIVLSGGAAGLHNVYAKEAAFQGHMAAHKEQDDKKRIWVLEEQMLEYRELFGDILERATVKQKKRYRRWGIELDMLYDKMDAKG